MRLGRQSENIARRGVVIVIATCFFSFNIMVDAKPSAKVKSILNRAETPNKVTEKLLLPYLFSTESMGLNIGVGGMVSGYHQDQMTIGGTAFGGDVSYGVGAGVWDYRLPKTDRLYFSILGMLGYYPDQRAYASPRDTYTPISEPLAGSNDSSNDSYIEANGSSNWWEMKLELSLPIGATRNQGMVKYETSRGLLTSEPTGGESWNPLDTGASVLILRQFNRYQSFETGPNAIDGTIHAFELGLLYNNTDFAINPSTGSSQYIAVTHDPAWLDSDRRWTFIDLEMSKYVSLGQSKTASQRIIAMNFWTGYSPSWQLEYDNAGGQQVTDSAPYNEGATLGGFYRMRGYDQNRFHDKAAIYGSLEYRYTFKYNPIADIRWLKFLRLDWFQLVGFAEAGQVAGTYTTNALFADIKTDVGLSLRSLMAGVVIRADIAVSDESTNLWLMVDHPF
ncbi:MAG: BamA/TamA family outer membrane protein [Moritella sp.]|uniref:BamA/TamA family outer membrane protein n=1 Tax=Moritella sp. TaxID=78556 RepID=UPI0029AE28E6|nr:BamA/TamA family outer membrane protein [Moritella sp.]MDX2320008.1 BamA/TamA family outer membrane protein [Moritella sp.]